MKVLVTGGAGFIGSHVVNECADFGHEVIVVDNLVTGNRSNVDGRARFYELDFCTEDFRKLVEDEKPEVISHQAGQTLIHVSTREPFFDAQVNILGMIGLLQTCVKAGVRKVVFASSAGVYGQAATMPITEDTPFDPENPYAIAKASCEFYLRYFQKNSGLAYTVLRYGNVFGPRDQVTSDHAITVFMSQLLAGIRPTIHWDGNQTKDFVFVKDVAVANRMALDHGDNRVFNVAAGHPVTINEIYRYVAEAVGSDVEPMYGPKRQGDVRAAYFDISLAQSVLGWAPSTPFQEAIAATLAWYKQN